MKQAIASSRIGSSVSKLKKAAATLAVSLASILASIPAQGQTTVTIDTSNVRPPISKYIYGQFIEHLGKSIYGGLWAEMLEDRKFLYPITDQYDPWGSDEDKFWESGPFQYLKASPWRVIGPANTVTMDKQHPYVGEHSPVIRLPGDGTAAGIAQEGLAVRAQQPCRGHIVLAGDATAAPIKVSLILDKGWILTQSINTISDEFKAYPLDFLPASASDKVRIEITSSGKGSFRIGTLSLMPSDNVQGWRADTIARLQELDAAIYRWPGGNFVSGYNWRDGIGPRDKRPPRKNPAWKNIEHNDVGIDEFMTLMEYIKAEPYVALNNGLGTPEEAAAEAEYCNGAPESPMGKLRAANGRREPYGVKYFAVGNEMFGTWQLGYMPVEQYVKKHNATAEAIWKIDPRAQLVGCGDPGNNWDVMMLKHCAGAMNLISEHVYCKEQKDPAQHALQLPAAIRRVADAQREYRRTIPELQGKAIPVTMDEWNFWYGRYAYGELGTQYRLKDALGVAMGLHEFYRDTDVFQMANYAQTVNVLGAIKTTGTQASLESTGLVLALYRRQYGVLPIDLGNQPAVLDIAAAWTQDKKTITLSIVNANKTAEEVRPNFGNIRFQEKARQWQIAGNDPESFNEPGKPPVLSIKEQEIAGNTGGFTVPPYSITLIRLDAR